MPVLKKDILPTGTYLVNTEKGRVRKTFDKEYLERIVSTGNAMLSAGLKIPAPFDHKKQAVPKSDQEIEIDNKGASAYNNAGYWQHFLVGDVDGKPTLQGLVDLPGSKEDANSPYYKAINTTKEVSISLLDYTDGLSRLWKDAPVHVALVNHPVVPGQRDFEEMPDGSMVVNMAMLDPGDEGETLIDELKIALREAANLVLPDNCSSATFLRDLLVAASQLRHAKPSHDTMEPVPVYMSTGDLDMAMTQEQAQAIVDTKAINPATKAPFTMADLGYQTKEAVSLSTLKAELEEKDKKIASAQVAIQAFTKKIIDDTSKFIQQRINNLVNKGVITKEHADAHLIPKVAYNMSIENGGIADHPLEMVLSTLEATAPANTHASSTEAPFDGTIRIPGLEQDTPLDDASIEAAMKDFEEFIV